MSNSNPFLVVNESEIDILIERLKNTFSTSKPDKEKIKYYLKSLKHEIHNRHYGLSNYQLETLINLLLETNDFSGVNYSEKLYIVNNLLIPNMNITADLVRKVIGNIGINDIDTLEIRFVDMKLQKALLRWLVCIIMVQNHNNFEKLNNVLIQMNTVLFTLIGLNATTAQYVTQLCYITDISKCLDIVKPWKIDYLKDLTKKNMNSSIYVRALLQYYMSVFNSNQRFKLTNDSQNGENSFNDDYDFEDDEYSFDLNNNPGLKILSGSSSLDLRKTFRYPDMNFLNIWKKVLEEKSNYSIISQESKVSTRKNSLSGKNMTNLNKIDTQENQNSDDNYDTEKSNDIIPASKDIGDIRYAIDETMEEQSIFVKSSVSTNGNKRYRINSEEDDTSRYFKIIQKVNIKPDNDGNMVAKDLINWSNINYMDLSDFIIENLQLLEVPVSQLSLLFEDERDNLKIYLMIELLLNYGNDINWVISQIDKYLRLVISYGYTGESTSSTSLRFIKVVINGIHKLCKVGNCVRIPTIRDILLLKEPIDENYHFKINEDIKEYIILKFFTMFSISNDDKKEKQSSKRLNFLTLNNMSIMMRYNQYFLKRGKQSKSFILRFVKTLIIAFKKWIFEIKYSHDDNISIENDKSFNFLLKIYDAFQFSMLELLMYNYRETKEYSNINDDSLLYYHVIQFVSLIEYFPIDEKSDDSTKIDEKKKLKEEDENDDKQIRFYYFRMTSPILIIFLLTTDNQEKKKKVAYTQEDVNQSLLMEYMRYVCSYPFDELLKSLKVMESDLVDYSENLDPSSQVDEIENVRNEIKYLSYCIHVKSIYSRFLQLEEEKKYGITKNKRVHKEERYSFWRLLADDK